MLTSSAANPLRSGASTEPVNITPRSTYHRLCGIPHGSVRLTVGSTGVYWLFPAASKRPGKVMANAFSAGFHRFIHRFLAVPVGSRERATR